MLVELQIGTFVIVYDISTQVVVNLVLLLVNTTVLKYPPLHVQNTFVVFLT